MVNILEELNNKLNNKFEYLKLLNVVYDVDETTCTITLLYPFYIDEIDPKDKENIMKFFQEFLSLQGQLKIKFKKSFLDESLINEEVYNFFKENKKGIFPYINKDNISSKNEEKRVDIFIKLNQDVVSLLNIFEFESEIKKHIEKLFIADIFVKVLTNDEKLPNEIIADDIIPTSKKAARYDVKVEKIIAGGEIIPKPEYIKDIKSPKPSVILAGFITNKQRKTFIQKKGKHVGEEKAFYTFTLKDMWDGNIDCVYFCSKAHEKDMEALDDLFMILCVGDVDIGFTGKLTYKIKKISLASPCQEIVDKIIQPEKVEFKHKKVVFPDLMPSASQANLFDVKKEYNEFIMNNKIVVFDIETTGLDHEECEITELGAVKIEYGKLTERFSSFAKPKEPIPLEVQNITHITDEMVADAPKVEDVVYDFYEWSKDCIIAGHNIIGFDMKFIYKVAERIGVVFDNELCDTLQVARKSNLRVTNYKLGTIAKALDITLVDAHRAYNDAHATALVLLELNRIN